MASTNLQQSKQHVLLRHCRLETHPSCALIMGSALQFLLVRYGVDICLKHMEKLCYET